MGMQKEPSFKERGQVVILAALLLPVLAGVGALALDLAYLYGQQQSSQVAADAGAQAGATALAMGYSTSVGTADAKKYVSLNGFKDSNSTIQVNIPPLSPPALQTYGSGYVQVVIKLNMNPLLAGVIGITGLKSTVEAVASESDVFRNRAVLYALDHSASASLSTSGSNACLVVVGGIIVNSNSSTAISTSGGNSCASGIHIQGTTISEVGGYAGGCCSPVPSTMPVPVPDPLGGVQMPQFSSGHWSLPNGTTLSSQTISGTTLNPGVYSGGIILSGGNYTMNPGVYILDGGGFNLSGSASISGNGVFIYNTSSTTPSTCSPVSITGQGDINLNAPTSGTYRGVVLAQDRSCPTAATISGNGNVNIDGGVYFYDATLNLSGNGSQSGGLQVLIVANKVSMSGNGVVQVGKPDASHSPLLVGEVLVE
jgi:Flp pilus assembly protein TadG